MAQASAVSGRGVGMDVVKTNIQKLNGSIEIRSEPGKGSVFVISLPLTLAILPVLLVLLGEQPFALPLSMVREILPIDHERMQEVGGKETVVVRGEILPVIALSRLLGWPQVQRPEYGVLMQTAERSFILAVDNFAGRDDAVIKALDDFRPRGVAGVTTLSNGQIVLILDMKELLSDLSATTTATCAQRTDQGARILRVNMCRQVVFFQGATAPIFLCASATSVAGAPLSENWSK
jgi:two-component system chemotaxis sensor kinase CheA